MAAQRAIEHDPAGAGDILLDVSHADNRPLAAVVDSNDPERVATQIREAALPAFMYATLNEIFGHGGAMAFKIYRDRLVADCGLGPGSDPIAVMLVEQLALAHLNIGRLHDKAATAAGVDEFRAYSSSATQLAGEFRRGALALKEYRGPTLDVSASTRNVAGDGAGKSAKIGGRRRTGT